MENVEQRVKKIVAEQLGVNEAEIKNESSFVDESCTTVLFGHDRGLTPDMSGIDTSD